MEWNSQWLLMLLCTAVLPMLSIAVPGKLLAVVVVDRDEPTSLLTNNLFSLCEQDLPPDAVVVLSPPEPSDTRNGFLMTSGVTHALEMVTHQCRFYRQFAALKEDEEKEIEFLHLSLDPSLSDAPYVLRAPSAVPTQLGRPPQETEASESQQEYPDHECSISQQLTGECLSTEFFSSDDGINMDLESNLETKTESELFEIDDFPDALKLILEMSSGGHILFIDHPLQLSFSNTTSILLSGLSSPSATFDQQPAATVGAQIVDFGRTVVLSAGIDLAVEGFVPRNEREWSFQRAHRNVARPHHRWSGVRFRDRRSSGVQLVEAVSGVYLTTAAHFETVMKQPSFHPHQKSLFEAWILMSSTYRALLMSQPFPIPIDNNPISWPALYVPEALAFYLGNGLKFGTAMNTKDEELIDVLDQTWQQRISSKHQLDTTVSSSVVWAMECSNGATLGFTREAISFVVALEPLLPLSVAIQDWTGCLSHVINDLPPFQAQALRRMYLKKINDTLGVILVIHKDPGRYEATVSSVRGSSFSFDKLQHTIGRSMFETDRIPTSWLAPCDNPDLAHEIWVPTSFNLHTFASAGVRLAKLSVIPEPLEVDSFDPRVAVPNLLCSPIPFLTNSTADEFRFLSVFKWEERKNWQGLFSAYFEEFTSSDHVSLLIRSSMSPSSWGEFRTFLNTFNFSLRTDLPSVVFLQRAIDTMQLPLLYASAHAFVLPSRGEGWGLPIAEALSMNLPTIATNWSGITEYLDDHSGYPIRVTSLQAQEPGGDHLWATPDQLHLQQLMREVFSSRGHSRLQCSTPRDAMVQRFSPEFIAQSVVKALDVSTEKIRHRGLLKLQREQKRTTRSLFDRDLVQMNIIHF